MSLFLLPTLPAGGYFETAEAQFSAVLTWVTRVWRDQGSVLAPVF
jgi:hypothetical protein